MVKSRGFTLIELVVVIVILAILSVYAAPRFLGVNTDAKKATMEAIGGSMRTGIELVHAKAAVQGLDSGSQTIDINGVMIAVSGGYPSVNGSDSFTDLNSQVQAWLDIDSVDRNTARDDRNAAPLFIDKWSRKNRLYIFFTSDYDRKSVYLKCQVMFENSVDPTVQVLTDDC